MNKELTIDPRTTALVLIDLQKGIASIQTAPLSSAEVIANSNKLIDAFHLQKAQVVIVRVAFNKDRSDALHPEVDEPMASNLNALPEDWSTIVPELRCDKNDLFITKHQWGAFYGTELDLQLRRKGIKTILIMVWNLLQEMALNWVIRWYLLWMLWLRELLLIMNLQLPEYSLVWVL